MPTPDEARRTLALVSNTAVAQAVNLFHATRNVDELLVDIPDVIAYYSDGTAALAADHYDDLRDAADAPGRFTAEPIVNLREEKIRRGVLWAVGPLALDEPDPVLAEERLAQIVQLESARPFRDTILGNQQRDPAAVGWQRQTSGKGCKFCTMLAGRGAVYREATARFASHPHCSCSASPVFDGTAGPEATVLQYVASQRRRTPSQRQALNDYLARLPD
jgi:hypothetical protein